jgi:hypothetical protein
MAIIFPLGLPLLCPIGYGRLVFIFTEFQEPFNFLFYFINDPLIIEQSSASNCLHFTILLVFAEF